MRACLGFLCLLAATLALSVTSKPNGKHHGLHHHKTSHLAKEKDAITEETNMPQVLPTSVPFEGRIQEQEDEELSSEENANTNKEDGDFKVTEKDKGAAVLLSEEELADLLKKEEEEEEEEEEEVGESELDEVTVDKGKVEFVEISEDTEAEEEEELDNLETEEESKEVTDEREEMEKSLGDKVYEEIDKNMMEESGGKMADKEKQGALMEETDGSAESDIPFDLDYAADSSILHMISAKLKHNTDDVSDAKQKEASEKELLSISEDYEMQNTEAANSEDEESDREKLRENKNKRKRYSQAKSREINQHVEPQQPKSSRGLESRLRGKEEEKSKNERGSHTKGKTRKQKKKQRARKHSPQGEETESGQDLGQQDPQESESSSPDNTVNKAKRRRAGKWGPLVGLNPVQIRGTVDLFPSSRPSLNTGIHHPEDPADPCDNFRCKRGKTCKLDADNKPGCVCQEPSQCPPGLNDFDHVCGTDNKTYDTSCELFATKCNLEGTKRGHKLHLDYTGPCKLIPPCVDTELIQFPLRMRDWLKNVLLQLYEHDTVSSYDHDRTDFLTPKQRYRVKKIFESERRLHAGDHPVELLAQDFEKNYNMYIYPVHWQFAQLDQHPSDRFLSHSELAPLRVPLVPMEHCTSRFFQECDADKDKQVSFREWTSCFGIKDEDMDVNLLF